MAICPAGHQTSQTDFCDTCGLPVPTAQPDQLQPAAPAAAGAPVVAPPVVCPNCQTPNVADALFCEACGYDFTTGALPEAPDGGPAFEPAPAEPVATADPTPAAEDPAPGGEPVAETAGAGDAGDEATGPATEPEGPGVPAGEAPAEPTTEPAAAPGPEPLPPPVADAPQPTPEAGPATVVPAPAPVQESQPEPAAPPTPPTVEWVAELWIDPDWYAAQGSTDPMPSPGLPDIAPLVKESNLIGRVSHSRGIFPDVDCELDTGCSRRHAMLTTDGARWWIEDLDSANGTFVGAAAGPLPAMPIPRGRVELGPGQRIYVGAWTRIVIRRATPDEQEAFAG